MQSMTGKTLGNYQVMEELGRGGMAVVYRAYQSSLNRYVAIKILPPQLSANREFVERFQREARAAAGLRHPNIVVIHDVGHDEGIYYIVMELLEGRTLKQLIEREGRLSPERAAHIIEQVGDALDYAHQRGFIHRDVKPSNIFIGPQDRVTLTDFGIAKAASEAQQLTREGMLMGTPEYMSPEQATGAKVDYRTDLYALGVVLYQMLVGRTPFRGTTPHATLHAVIYEPPPPPRQINPYISPAVEQVVLRAMAKRPEHRYQSGAEMAHALKKALAAPATPARQPVIAPVTVPPPPRPVEPPPARSSPLLWVLAALAFVLILALGVLLVLAFAGKGTPTPIAPTATVAIVWKTATPLPGVAATATLQPTAPPSAATQAPTAPPTARPTSPPNTQAPSPTPVPPTRTPRPTPTPTKKPPTPTWTPTPTRTPSCPFDAQGIFAGLWQAYKDQLGCPLYQSPQVIQDAEQAFEYGHMFWRQDNDRAYVVYESGSRSGTYESPNITWQEGVDPEYSCAASPPPGKVQPKRGFGKVWCSLGGPSAAIGWGLGEEAGFWAGRGDPMVQDFERGFIFRDSDGTTTGRAYVFFADTGTFVRVPY
ncbi:MAG TPA: serine/threonine protein kinase [Anaerolineae bacterium]|nr:serine/threonine protein kinase [Anaerolineae bacterium]